MSPKILEFLMITNFNQFLYTEKNIFKNFTCCFLKIPLPLEILVIPVAW